MTLFTKRASDIFAPTDASGTSRSVANDDVQTWGYEVERSINAGISAGALVYATKADIDADLAHPANTGGWVVADPMAANNGIYAKSGSSGLGSWARMDDLPVGDDGWSPLIRFTSDGVRRVLQIYDWAGGAGSKPQIGYLGATGLVADIALATDIRGPQGASGDGSGDMVFAADVIDEDDMASDSDTKVPTQQSVNQGKLQKVTDRTAMKALAGSNHLSAYLMEAGREGVFNWSGSNLSALVSADTAEGIFVAPTSDPTGASGAWVRQRDNPVMYADWCGAVGDGVTDDATAFQAALNFVSAVGGKFALKAKKYIVAAALTLALPNVGLAECNHVKLCGEGGALTVVKYTGAAASQFLTITGPTWGQSGVGAKFRVEGITLDGGDYTKNGLWLQRCINYEFHDAHFTQWLEGHRLTDAVLGQYSYCMWTFNVNGLYTEFTVGTNNSPANELTFTGCGFTSNRGYGAWFNYSAPVTFIGGTIEGNGHPGVWPAITNRWGIRINGGFNGATPLNMYGTHTESNAGSADVYIVHGSHDACVYNIQAIDFINNGAATEWVTNSIAFVSGTGTATLNINGCGFNHVNGYTPSAARARIGLYGTLANCRVNIDPSCQFSSSVDAPTGMGKVAITNSVQSSVTAGVRFTTGASPSMLKQVNVASVTHSATGVYVVTLAVPLQNASILYEVTLGGGVGFVSFAGITGGTTPTAFTINTYNSSGTLADVGTEISFTVVGGLY